jgi:hypothetical protein
VHRLGEGQGNVRERTSAINRCALARLLYPDRVTFPRVRGIVHGLSGSALVQRLEGTLGRLR